MWYTEITTYKDRYKLAMNPVKTKFIVLYNDKSLKQNCELLSYDVTDFGASLLATDLVCWLKEDGLTNCRVQTIQQMKEEIVDILSTAVGNIFHLIDVDDYTGDDE